MGHALVLNATYEPLCVVPARRALLLVLDAQGHRGRGLRPRAAQRDASQLPAPAVVRLTRYVRIPYRGPVPLTRRAVFARDGGRCVYCGVPATSIDHVVPRSRGGAARVGATSCRPAARCNHVKADRTVADLGWRLHPPQEPTGTAWRILGTGRLRPELGALPRGVRRRVVAGVVSA